VFGKLISKFRGKGFAGVCAAVADRLVPFPTRVRCRRLVRGKRGIEIGGPSSIFARGGMLALYDAASNVDGCNFSADTLWAGHIPEGMTYRYMEGKACGRQYVSEAANLGKIPSDSYDFFLSSHVLEHVANPLKALSEWRRVLKPGGWLIMLLPLKDMTFDHRRPVTALEHLIEDFSRDAGEDDLTHLPEILALHDLSRDPQAGTPEQFAARSRENFKNRCLHQHVFDEKLAVAVCRRAGFEVTFSSTSRCLQIVIIACKKA